MELTKEQQNKIDEIGRKYNLKLILLHGSYATGKQRPGSDLDIAILGHKPVSFDDQLKFFGEFGQIFGNNQERELDIKSLHGTDVLFKFQVARDAALLYGDASDFTEFKMYTYRAYRDSRDLFNLEHALTKKRQAHLMAAINH